MNRRIISATLLLLGTAACQSPGLTQAAFDKMQRDNQAYKDGYAAADASHLRRGASIADAFFGSRKSTDVITVTDQVGHQVAFQSPRREKEAVCGLQIGGRKATAIGYDWFDYQPSQQMDRCVDLREIKRIETGRKRGFLGDGRS